MENSVILSEAGKARHKANVVLQLLIFLAVYVISSFAGAILGGIVTGASMAGSVMQQLDPAELMSGTIDIEAFTQELLAAMPPWFMAVSLYVTIIATTLVIVYCRSIEGRSSASMGLRMDGFFKKYGIGFAVGIALMLASAGLASALGAVHFTGVVDEVPWGYVVLFFGGYLFQGMSEEVAFRGYLAVSLANKTRVSVAVGISSVLFAAAHLMNPGITPLAFINLALFGVFTGVYMFRTDDLWGVCAIHSSWNFVQGNILGISVSGGAAQSSVFGTVFVEGRELISGGSFGLEGGVCVTAVILAAIALTLFLPKKPRPALPDEPEEKPEPEPIPLYIQK